MKTIDQNHASMDAPAPAPHRYQVFQQARNGCHHHYGSSIASAEEAVDVFLATAPMFEGGGIRLWDHHEQRTVASVEWLVEITRFGFPVRTRANAFYDDGIAQLAQRAIEREAYFQSLAERLNQSAS
jgi:hypothetical protein